jgi:hypothetical protein
LLLICKVQPLCSGICATLGDEKVCWPYTCLVCNGCVANFFPPPLKTHTRLAFTVCTVLVSTSKHLKYKTKTLPIPLAPYPPPEVNSAVIVRESVFTKTVPLCAALILLLLVLSCDDPQQRAKTLALFRSLVQLNNKPSINLITSLCWSYFSRRAPGDYILYPFSKYQAFLAALVRDHGKPAQTDRTDRPLYATTTTTTTTTTGEHKTTAATGQHDTGSSADSDVPCLRYFT